MASVFVEGMNDDPAAKETAANCSTIHRVGWRGGIRTESGEQLVAQFDAPDTESVRRALRNLDCNYERAWPGFVYRGAASVVPNRAVVLASIDPPVSAEDTHLCRADLHRVHEVYSEFARAYVSCDWSRMIVMYRAPDCGPIRCKMSRWREEKVAYL